MIKIQLTGCVLVIKTDHFKF